MCRMFQTVLAQNGRIADMVKSGLFEDIMLQSPHLIALPPDTHPEVELARQYSARPTQDVYHYRRFQNPRCREGDLTTRKFQLTTT